MKIVGVDYENGKTVGLDVLCDGDQRVHFTPTANVVDREQYNELYEENLKLREEINNLAGEELPWAIVTVRTHNKGESPYRYHCPHCGYSHKKPSHYCSNCGRRCKE